MAGILFSGDVFFDRLDDDGGSTGLVHIGNASQFQITETSNIKERTSKMRASYGQVLDSVAIKSPAKIAITLDDMNRANLALVLLGKDAVANQAAAPSQTKSFDMTTVDAGIYHEIGATRITVPSVKIGTDAVAANAYVLDADAGLIMSTEDAPTEGTLVVTYSVPAMAGYVISGGASPTVKGRLLLKGKNLADMSAGTVDVAEAVLTPKSGLDFLASDFASAQLEGTLNTPSGAAAPYTVTVLAAAA